MSSNVNIEHWLTPQEFAKRIQSSASFVYRKIKAGMIPTRAIPGVGRTAIHERHVKRFNPFSKRAQLFHTDAVIERTDLSRQTICDLLQHGELRYTVSDGNGNYEKRVVPLAAAKSGKRWLVTQNTLEAFLDAVRPSLAGWPTVSEVAHHLGCSNAYVLKRFEEGGIRGQQSIAGNRVYLHPTVITKLEGVNGCPHSIGDVARKTGLATTSLSDIARRGYILLKYSSESGELINERAEIKTAKRLKRFWFSDASVQHLLHATQPDRLGWPRAKDLEDELDLRGGTLSSYFLRGKLRGAISIIGKGRKLHIDPRDAEQLRFQCENSIAVVAHDAGVKPGTVRSWSKQSKFSFLLTGLLDREYVTPVTLERIRKLVEHRKMKRSTVALLALSEVEFNRAIMRLVHNAMYFDPDEPPTIDQCKEGNAVTFPDGRRGVIKKTVDDPFRPLVQVYIQEPQEDRANLLYAVARSCGCKSSSVMCECNPEGGKERINLQSQDALSL